MSSSWFSPCYFCDDDKNTWSQKKPWAALQFYCNGKVKHARVVFEMAQYRLCDLWSDSKPDDRCRTWHGKKNNFISKTRTTKNRYSTSQPHLRTDTETKTNCQQEVRIMSTFSASAEMAKIEMRKKAKWQRLNPWIRKLCVIKYPRLAYFQLTVKNKKVY